MDEGIFSKFIQTLNRHLPARRKTLSRLLREEKPAVMGKDGTLHAISRGELELLSTKIPEHEWNAIKLPVIIEMTPDLGNSAARIRGRIECRIVRELIGVKKGNNSMILYFPEILELRKKLPTATQYGFFALPK